MPDSIFRYFPLLSDSQKEKVSQLKEIYIRWNSLINLISRKDMDNFMIHHVLHSLSLAKIISFLPGTRVMDVGTGGGFPGIPLSIFFPDTEFTLLDSIEKKIKVVDSVIHELELKNVKTIRKRVEDEKGKFHFVISRAVTDFHGFVSITKKNIEYAGNNSLKNGILYLKGGDLTSELSLYHKSVILWKISDFFDEPFFETKKIVYLSV